MLNLFACVCAPPSTRAAVHIFSASRHACLSLWKQYNFPWQDPYAVVIPAIQADVHVHMKVYPQNVAHKRPHPKWSGCSCNLYFHHRNLQSSKWQKVTQPSWDRSVALHELLMRPVYVGLNSWVLFSREYSAVYLLDPVLSNHGGIVKCGKTWVWRS